MIEQLQAAWRSRTVRFSLLLVILGQLQVYFPLLQKYLTADLYGFLLSSIGVAVFVLRVLTTVPLAEK